MARHRYARCRRRAAAMPFTHCHDADTLRFHNSRHVGMPPDTPRYAAMPLPLSMLCRAAFAMFATLQRESRYIQHITE